MNNIEILSEQLEFLQITKETLDEYNRRDIEMLVTLATINKNIQAVIPKNMVLDLGWFNSDQIKFKDWWRGI